MRKLSDFIRKVESFASPSYYDNIRKAVAEESLRLVDRCFRQQCDPYGNPWAPTKSGGRIEVKTGEFRRGFRAEPSTSGVLIVNYAPYANAQTYGAVYGARSGKGTIWHSLNTGKLVGKKTKAKLVAETRFSYTKKEHRLVPRPAVPNAFNGLPRSWHEAFRKVFRKVAREQVK